MSTPLTQDNRIERPRDWLGLVLIIISSLLLGIWAVRGTIALRNLLLITGTIVGTLYLIINYSQIFNRLFLRKHSNEIWPIILIGFLYFWIILCFFFFARYPEQMGGDIKSIWLRSLLGFILGVSGGIAVQKRPGLYWILWVGMIFSFLILFLQYVPKAVSANSLFAPDFEGYIYFGKADGYLVGSILLAGLFGGILSDIASNKFSFNEKFLLAKISLSLVGIILVFYSYIYIFDTRNGLAIVAIVYSSVLGVYLLRLIKYRRQRLFNLQPKLIGFFALFFLTIAFFYTQQTKLNDGWTTTLKDAYIGIQIDRYPHWNSFNLIAYPKDKDGRTVKLNTYQRFAWGTAGLRAIEKYPLGIGTLQKPLLLALGDDYPNLHLNATSTLSGFIDIGIALGIPGLALLLLAIFILIFSSACQLLRSYPKKFSACTYAIGIALICTYTLGEHGNKHGIEILLYFIGFITVLNFTMLKNINEK